MPSSWLDAQDVVLDYTDGDIFEIDPWKLDSAEQRFIEMAVDNNDVGQHWFEEGAMRYAHTRLHRGTHHSTGNTLEFFVTSERPDVDSPWLYSLRSFNWDTGRVSTIGEFNFYTSFDAAWESIP
jgi:hypothetical protein